MQLGMPSPGSQMLGSFLTAFLEPILAEDGQPFGHTGLSLAVKFQGRTKQFEEGGLEVPAELCRRTVDAAFPNAPMQL